MWGFGKFALIASAIVGVFAFAAQASATTFCVPDYFEACPDNGTNVLSTGSSPAAKLEAALGLNAGDGIADTVYLDTGAYVDPDSFTATTSGTDDLTVIGAGRDETFLSSSSTANVYVLNLASGNSREITVKDLAVVIPASLPNNAGAGIVARADHFRSIDLISRNEKSNGVFNPDGGTSFEDFRAFGQNGGSLGGVFYQYNSCGTGEFTIDRAEISDAGSGLIWNCPDVPAIVNRVHFSATDDAIDVSSGGHASVTNALIESAEGPPIRLYNGSNLITSLTLNHLTVVATGDPNQPAIRARVDGLASPTKNIEISLANSIISGFQNTWSLEAPFDPVKGNINLSAAYSDLPSSGLTAGESFTDDSIGNISEPPGFAGITDFRLAGGSPAIDAGDHDALAPELDLDGTARPLDGDRDGAAIRDMGAFEFEPPPLSCPADPSLCPTDPDDPEDPEDRQAPKVSKVKFRYKSGKGGALRFRLSERATVVAIFRPIPKKAKGKKRKRLRLQRQPKAGAVRIKLDRKALRPGRYRLVIRATDGAGNRSKPIVRKVRAKRQRRPGD